MLDKVSLTIYVHNFVPQEGHSRAMIETLKNLPSNNIEHLFIVCYKSCDIHTELPDFSNKHTVLKVPNIIKYPFLFNALFFYIYTWFLTKVKIPHNSKKIGIGISSLSADYVNIQFIHKELEHFYFKTTNFTFVSYLYKRALFFMYFICERYLYMYKDTTQFSVLSSFEKEYLEEEFQVPESKIVLNYSGICTDNFHFDENETF